MIGVAQRACNVDDAGEVGEAVHFQQRRRGTQDDRAKRRRRHAGQSGQCGHVVRACRWRGAVSHLVVDHQQAVRLAARRAELVLVNLAEHMALVELDGAFQVATDFVPAGVEQFDFEACALVGAVHQPGDAAPGTFQAAQPRVVQDASTCSDSIVSIAAISRSSAPRSASGSARSRSPTSLPNQRSTASPPSLTRKSERASSRSRSRVPTKRPDRIASRSGATAGGAALGAEAAASATMVADAPGSRSVSFTTLPAPGGPARLARGSRNAGHHAHARGQLFHLQPGPQIGDGVVGTRTGRGFRAPPPSPRAAGSGPSSPAPAFSLPLT